MFKLVLRAACVVAALAAGLSACSSSPSSGDETGASTERVGTVQQALTLPPTNLRVIKNTSCPPVVWIQWDRPAGYTSLFYMVTRDDVPIRPTVNNNFGGEISADNGMGLLPGGTFVYRVGAYDPSGSLVYSAPLSVTLPPACQAPEFSNGLQLGVVLVRYSNVTAPAPFDRTSVFNAFYNSQFSVANYFNQVSRGRVSVTGDVSNWITLPYDVTADCASVQADGLGYQCDPNIDRINQYVRQSGFPIDSFERTVYYAQGVGAAGEQINAAAFMSASSPLRTDSAIHELGHSFGLNHSGIWQCPGGGSGPSLTELDAGGCFPSRYGDGFDPMGVASLPFDSRNLFLLGWLDASERQTAVLGQTYQVGSLQSATYPLKELSVTLPQNNQYFLEYRTAQGFNALPSCETCSPETIAPAANVPRGGMLVRLWSTNRLLDGQSFLDTDSYNLTPSPLQVGQKFVDNYRGVTLRVLADNGEAATVQVLSHADCHDGVKDGDETDRDCGGSCGPCLQGQGCFEAADCQSADCRAGSCYLDPVVIHTATDFACAQFSDGSLRCWGDNDHGQLGVVSAGPIGDQPGEMGLNLRPVPLSGSVVDFALGDAHACAVLVDGAVECWGKNDSGQLGVGDTLDRIGVVVRPSLPASAVSLALGDGFTCATLTDSTIRCWGTNSLGQLGRGSTQTIGDGPNEMGNALVAVGVSGLPSQIAAGANHVCALTLDQTFHNQLQCWGTRSSGEIGSELGGAAYGDSSAELNPPLVNLGTGFEPTAVTAGVNHTCALSRRGTVKCWGSSLFGQLGYGDTTTRGRTSATMGDALLTVPIGGPIRSLQAHIHNTCVKFVDGSVKCWGLTGAALGQPAFSNQWGLGDAPNEVAPSLPAIDLGPGFVASSIAVGGFFDCALSVDHRLKCWGLNTSGQLGAGDVVSRGTLATDLGANLPFVAVP